MYITPQDELHVEYQGIALTCPHCQTLTHLTAVAVPKFEDLARRKPKHVGIVFSCDTCIEPVFLKFFVKAYTPLRVELAANYTEIERARENFPLTYLPEEAEGLFKEALNCYSAGCFNAFGAMSRRTAQSLFRELGERETQQVTLDHADPLEAPVLRRIRDPAVEVGESSDGFRREIGAPVVARRAGAVHRRHAGRDRFNRRPAGEVPRVQELEGAHPRLSLGALHG